MISGKMQIYAHLFFDSVPSHFKHFRIKYCLQNTILNLTNKVLVQHCQKIQLILKSVILYIYAHLFCLPIFSIASLATFVQFFTFWNRIIKGFKSFKKGQKMLKKITEKILSLLIWIISIAIHGMFLEWRNTAKSLSNIWQYFSCLLDERIPKICKKLNSHDGFLSYLQNSKANSAHLAADFCPALVCPQRALMRIQFLPYFWNPLIK